MRKFTLSKPATLTLTAASSIPIPAETRTLSGLDFGNVHWLINAEAQTVSARAPGWPVVLIMGGTAKTPWTDAWSQQAFENALIAQIAFPVATAALVAPSTAGTPPPPQAARRVPASAPRAPAVQGS